MRTLRNLMLPLALAGLASPALADAQHGLTYEVTITNITEAQTFTPQLVAVHSDRVALFEPGAPASEALEILAEAGDTAPATAALMAAGKDVADVETIPGLLGPGQSATVAVHARGRARYLTLAAMLIPTNDNFVALNTVRLPRHGSSRFYARAWDAGTEANDQNCANIPGPRCGGAGYSPGINDGDEGHVHVSNGFHELGDSDAAGNEILAPETYDWRNPVAVVTVTRVRH